MVKSIVRIVERILEKVMMIIIIVNGEPGSEAPRNSYSTEYGLGRKATHCLSVDAF